MVNVTSNSHEIWLNTIDRIVKGKKEEYEEAIKFWEELILKKRIEIENYEESILIFSAEKDKKILYRLKEKIEEIENEIGEYKNYIFDSKRTYNEFFEHWELERKKTLIDQKEEKERFEKACTDAKARQDKILEEIRRKN